MSSQLCDRLLHHCLLCIFAPESSHVYLISSLHVSSPSCLEHQRIAFFCCNFEWFYLDNCSGFSKLNAWKQFSYLLGSSFLQGHCPISAFMLAQNRCILLPVSLVPLFLWVYLPAFSLISTLFSASLSSLSFYPLPFLSLHLAVFFPPLRYLVTLLQS